MKNLLRVLPLASLLLLPVTVRAQKAGQIICGPRDAYSYLYSSMTTMEVISKIGCGDTVRVLDRSDNFVRVQTAEGAVGYVALNSIAFLKNGAAPKAAPQPSHYDKPEPPAKPAAGRGELVIANQTAVHLKLGRPLSSETAKVGEEVNFEVAEDVVVNGRTVVNKGAPAVGAVTEAEPRGRMGKAGKLNVSVSSAQLADGEKLPLRSFGINTTNEQKSGVALPKFHGKEITFTQGAEMTAYVDGDQHLSAAKFAAAAPAATAQSANTKP